MLEPKCSSGRNEIDKWIGFPEDASSVQRSSEKRVTMIPMAVKSGAVNRRRTRQLRGRG